MNDTATKAPTQLETVTQKLREMILGGCFVPGRKIAEVDLAERFAVSRTPVRLALQILEKEGLLRSAPRRGFTVRVFTIEEVIEAIDVRGHLEGMAARLAAEQGLPEALDMQLMQCLDVAQEIINRPLINDDDRAKWVESNRCFHAGIVEAAANAILADAIEHVGRVPLAPPSAIVFDTSDPEGMRHLMDVALADHRAVLGAIRGRQGARAEALMREHAYHSRENKRRNIDEIKANQSAASLPGLNLVSTSL